VALIGSLLNNQIMLLTYLLYVILALCVVLLANRYIFSKRRNTSAPLSTLIVLGSGGHTTEMLSFLSTLEEKNYSPRYYIVAQSEKGKNDSRNKATQFEQELQSTSKWRILDIPRAREVGQSYFTSIFTTIHALIYSMWLVASLKPDLVITLINNEVCIYFILDSYKRTWYLCSNLCISFIIKDIWY
jgi:beta-1,4-N-acetylglucosaminyltransferase